MTKTGTDAMTLSIELPSEKILKFQQKAKAAGLPPDEFAKKIVEIIIDASEDELESWIETSEILSDKQFAHKLLQSIDQAKEGRLHDWKEVKKELDLK
jgi:hypothetical protein